MKLPDHVDHIRTLINKAFDNQFSRLGLGPAKMLEIEKIPKESHTKRQKLDVLIISHTGELGTYKEAREKALDELTFTLFNRLAAVKVMESLHLFPPVVTKQPEHGDRSFGHKIWLEENPEMRSEELEGLRHYFKDEFNKLGETIPLYHKSYPYALLPYVIDLNEIITAFNAVELDPQIEPEIWQSDDILGWLYESYNNFKKAAHKAGKAKTEYHKVSLQSQVYTPRWVVEFLVNNSLGKLYLEMYPHSDIKNRFKIANAPETKTREIKPLHEIKMIDPASGSGNFLLYGFEFFYQLYEDQIENYGADYNEDEIPKLIIENNLHGIDLDDRAIQLAQLGLWIKAKQKRRSINKLNFNIVSSDFYLPDFVFVEPIFKSGTTDSKQLSVIEDIWEDLQQAYKFGSLIKIEEKLNLKLHSLLDQSEITLFGEQELEEYERFKTSFLKNLETAISRFATQQGSSFLTDKTKDAITFLKLLTTKYDVATANPPYTDSSDFGPALKIFIENNYRKPYKFHTNLYATFIKRSFELINVDGYLAMLHPLTFMYIITFADIRKYILSNTHINILVELGLGGVFANSEVQVDVVMYVLKNSKSNSKSLFFDFKKYKNHVNKPLIFKDALDHYIQKKEDSHTFLIEQSKLKVIKTWPFIYWISDAFREKFGKGDIKTLLSPAQGAATTDNFKFLRFWWEIDSSDISKDYPVDKKNWVIYSKGGPFRKWYGNLWLVLNYKNDGETLKNSGAVLRNSNLYFKEGITYSASGSKGATFRFLPPNSIFDTGGSCIFANKEFKDTFYLLGFMNSKLVSYIVDCLNPTVNAQVGDMQRIPFIIPSKESQEKISQLSRKNTSISQYLTSYSIYERNYNATQLFKSEQVKDKIQNFLNLENFLETQILINEALIDEEIFKVFDLTNQDKKMVLSKEGRNVGSLPVLKIAKETFKKEQGIPPEFNLDKIGQFIDNLPEVEFIMTEKEEVVTDFSSLYQGNNNLQEFCINHQINPINVWYWFKEGDLIPRQRMYNLTMEFLAVILREILMEDEDGIIPLVPNAGEEVLLDRLEKKFMEKGFSRTLPSFLEKVLGKELAEYLNKDFFIEFAFHLKLFKRLPATPFIWHLSSGPEQAFDCYIVIYKWSRDKLLSIRSRYIEQRERALENRRSDLRSKNNLTGAEQNELEKIFNQLKELDVFKKKIDELLQEGYKPILDDGVGKNIAPLQKKGMIPYEVLNAGQLKKYLNADW